MKKKDSTAAVFSALSDETRRHVMVALAKGGPVSATRLAEQIPITRQAVAKHLDALEQAGLVSSERVGRETRYQLTPEPMTQALDWIADVGAEWDSRLKRLRRLIDQ
ncbi:MAG: ArsR/SmtB family transcription factor [Acidimicrobiia bacterium]